jgi:conjugative relaxase-like TrwC/TraI family protein
VISIGRLSNATAAADYYLTRQAGCPMDYYTGAGERRGLWIGRGAHALHLTGELTTAHEQVFRQLLHGLGSDGRPLVSPVLRTDPRGLLDARPLVEAIRAADTELLRSGDPGHWHTFDALARRVGRSSLATVTVRADVALALAEAAGVDARQVYAGRGLSLDEALEHVNERIDVRRPGYDVVFSAPKSVSVVYALASPEIAEEVRAAHLSAIGEAMAYLELFVAQSVRGHKAEGRHGVRVRTDGLIAAAFEHRSSRADDPQLHTHVVIANLLQGPDGHWGAIDSAALYRHQLTAGYVYQAVLRGELTSRLGVEWTAVRRGLAEIGGVPKTLCREFSQRRQAIEARLSELGESGMNAARKACLDTRPPKQHTPEATQRDRWYTRAVEAGFDPADLQLTGTAEAPTVVDDEMVADLVSPEGLTAKSSTFDPRDVLRGVCEALPGGAHVDLTRLLDLGRAVVRNPETVVLLRSQAAGERSYSTVDMLAAEQRALELVAHSRPAGVAVVPSQTVDLVLAHDALSDEQRELVRRLLTSGAGVDVVVGPAGTGKTRALRAAREAWEANGHTVIGASLAAVAARELQNGSGIPATSLARFLGDLHRTGLPERAVIVVDEASMIGTRQHLELLEAARAHGAKLVLVGDPRQLSEIEAGGLFASLARSPEALQLTVNQRQVEVWEREALTALRDGDPGVALDSYADHDRIRLAADRQQLLDRLTADYLLARSSAPDEDVLVLAVRNFDVRSVNAEVRGRLREHGVLGTEEVRVGTEERARAYAAGDEVVITRNDYRLQVFNGTRAHVTHVDARSGQLSLSTRGGHEVVVPAAWAADRLDHAYAMTCHRAQGITVDVALLYGTAALSREAAYVAMSRGRMANYIYATHEELRGYDECGLDEHAQDADEVTLMAAQALGDAVSRSRRQRLAQDCLPLRHAEADEVSLRRGLREAG